jgi:hypothetical protein
MTLVAPRDKFLSDILITATEGGINYWAAVFWIMWDAERDVILEVVLQHIDTNGQPCGERLTIKPTDLEAAIAQVINRKVDVADYIWSMVVLGSAANAASEINPVAADALVQVALFGGVIYS